MNLEDLTKEFVEEMSDEEVRFWFQRLVAKEEVNQMRARMLANLEVAEAQRSANTIKINSTVIE